ncbi:putative D-inositol-3-phosphate glycosyltransferase [Hollandina sp. SP2]
MDNKINLLFDGTIISRSAMSKKSDRSGVFFVALNMLKTFLEDTHYNVFLCVYKNDYQKARHITRMFLSKKIKIIAIQDTNVCIKNINVHKKTIQVSNNMIKKMLCYLKILKNLLKLTWYNFSKGNSKILKKFNVFLSPSYENILEEIEKYPHIRRFIVIHDIIPFLDLSCYKNTDQYDNIPIHNIFKKPSNDYYFFISKNSKRDFIQYASGCADEKKMLVTYPASANNFVPQYDREKLVCVLKKYKIKFDSVNKYIFSFCSLEPRKNLPFTIKCFINFIQKNKITDFYFFLGGEAWNNYENIYKQEINNINDEYKNKIIHLGYVDDEDVNTLYSNSSFFVFLSKYEGFGMPVLEAMQSGTPVITSNNSSLPEVAGDAAILVDCESEEQCIKAFETLYFNENLRKEYIKKGIERAKLFTWKKTVDKMTEAIISTI